MAPGTVRVRILSGTQGERGEHMAPGDTPVVSAMFAHQLVARGRARIVTDPVDETPPPAVKPQHGDPVARHGDPKPRTRR